MVCCSSSVLLSSDEKEFESSLRCSVCSQVRSRSLSVCPGVETVGLFVRRKYEMSDWRLTFVRVLTSSVRCVDALDEA